MNGDEWATFGYSLLVGLLILVAVWWLVASRNLRAKLKAKAESALFPPVRWEPEPGNIEEGVIGYQSGRKFYVHKVFGTYRVRLRGDGWGYKELGNYPTKETAMTRVDEYWSRHYLGKEILS